MAPPTRGAGSKPLMARSSVNWSTLRAALQWAKKSKWISGELPYIEVPSQPPPRDRWMTRDEADKLLASAQALHIRTFIAARFAYGGPNCRAVGTHLGSGEP